MKQIPKRSGMALFAMMIFAGLATSVVQAGSLLDEIQVPDTCGTTYADKLASCVRFRCTKPSPMAMMLGFPSADQLQKMPLERQHKIRQSMALAEKKMAAMSPQERVAMKARMTSVLEIIGFDAQGQCQTSTLAIPGQRMDCHFDKSLRLQVSEYSRLTAQATGFELDSTSHAVNGKMVTESTVKVDGIKTTDPWTTALDNGQCSMMIKDADADWVSISQMNRLSHLEFNLLEHGKLVDGHIQILNSADGQILFDKDVETSHAARKINLQPGTFDIKVVSMSPRLSPVWFRGVKLGEANAFRKNVEFYAISGTLKLTVNLNGQPSKGAAVYIKDPDTNKWIGRWSVWKKPAFSFMPASIKLPETLSGRYQVFVAAVPNGVSVPDNATYKDFLLTINNGQTIEKTIDFGEIPHLQPAVKKATGQTQNTLFILDATGSMWGQINGKVNDLMYRIEDAGTGKIIRQPVLPTSSGRAIQLPGGEYNVFVLSATHNTCCVSGVKR